jgi:hypothetical protein
MLDTVIESFIITKNIFLEVTVPPFKEKCNYYYEPTDTLHKFDECSVTLIKDGQRTLLMKDVIQSILSSLYHSLNAVLKGSQKLPPAIVPGTLGKMYNIEYYTDQWLEDDQQAIFSVNYNDYWLWSCLHKVQSWIYNDSGKIYLEVGTSHPSIFSATATQNDKEFNEYIAHYTPILFIEISHATAQEWLEQCIKIIHIIDSEYILTESL